MNNRYNRDAEAARRIAQHAEESEKALERYLAEQVKRAGGLCLKFSSMTEAGYPDRLICLPGGAVVWAEVKSRGKKPGKLQQIRHARLRQLGMRVYVIDGRDGVRTLISENLRSDGVSPARVIKDTREQRNAVRDDEKHRIGRVTDNY